MSSSPLQPPTFRLPAYPEAPSLHSPILGLFIQVDHFQKQAPYSFRAQFASAAVPNYSLRVSFQQLADAQPEEDPSLDEEARICQSYSLARIEPVRAHPSATGSCFPELYSCEYVFIPSPRSLD